MPLKLKPKFDPAAIELKGDEMILISIKAAMLRLGIGSQPGFTKWLIGRAKIPLGSYGTAKLMHVKDFPRLLRELKAWKERDRPHARKRKYHQV